MSSPSTTQESPDARTMSKAVALAVVLGILGAISASVFLAVEGALYHFFWVYLPGLFGATTAPWWWVPIMLLVGAGLVIAAWRLGPGMGSPLDGFHFDIGPSQAAAALSVAMATLVFGAVLGPEAPLIACGTIVGGFMARKQGAQAQALAMALGGVAAIGLILGNPFITAFMILEFAAMGTLPRAALIPLFVALGSGYFVQIGLGPFSGIGESELSVPGLPVIDHVDLGVLIGAFAVSVVAGIAVLVSRQLGYSMRAFAAKRPRPAIIISALIVAALAIAVMLGFNQPAQSVLFSGEDGIGILLTETSLVTVIAITVAKSLAYGVSLGSGFRGGPIFPSVAIGVGCGVGAALLVPSLGLSAMVVTAIAAAVGAMLKLPFTGALLAYLITASAGSDAVPLAILGAVIGLVLRIAYDKVSGNQVPAQRFE